ncbi:MAG: hypothetical protein ABEK10_01540 [Candidatus Nanosalina sp.]
MTEITEEFVGERVESLRKDKEVIGVAVVGSYARAPDRSHNDLDLFVLVSGEWYKRKTEEIDGITVEYFYNSMNKAVEWLEGEQWWKNYHWYMNADVRYDPEDRFETLREKAEQVRDKEMNLTQQEKEEYAYEIWDNLQDLETDDVAQKRYLMNSFFDELVQKHYMLEEKVPVKNNYRVKHLRDFSGYMYKLAQDFLLASSTMEKEKTLQKIVEHVSDGLPEISAEFQTEKTKRN